MKVEDIHKNLVDVEKLIAGILEQIKQLAKSVDSLNEDRGVSAQRFNNLQRNSEKEFVALKKASTNYVDGPKRTACPTSSQR